MPALMALVIRSARRTSSVHTVAARPYSVSLASLMASASSSKGITDSTGPKISSRAMLMSLDTSANSVGATKLPCASSSPPARPPPHTRRAPSSWLRAIRPRTRSSCLVLISGAEVTSGVERVPVADHRADHLGGGEELLERVPVHQRPGLRRAHLAGQAE